jgi:hypothetical protein
MLTFGKLYKERKTLKFIPIQLYHIQYFFFANDGLRIAVTQSFLFLASGNLWNLKKELFLQDMAAQILPILDCNNQNMK